MELESWCNCWINKEVQSASFFFRDFRSWEQEVLNMQDYFWLTDLVFSSGGMTSSSFCKLEILSHWTVGVLHLWVKCRSFCLDFYATWSWNYIWRSFCFLLLLKVGDVFELSFAFCSDNRLPPLYWAMSWLACGESARNSPHQPHTLIT